MAPGTVQPKKSIQTTPNPSSKGKDKGEEGANSTSGESAIKSFATGNVFHVGKKGNSIVVYSGVSIFWPLDKENNLPFGTTPAVSIIPAALRFGQFEGIGHASVLFSPEISKDSEGWWARGRVGATFGALPPPFPGIDIYGFAEKNLKTVGARFGIGVCLGAQAFLIGPGVCIEAFGNPSKNPNSNNDPENPMVPPIAAGVRFGFTLESGLIASGIRMLSEK